MYREYLFFTVEYESLIFFKNSDFSIKNIVHALLPKLSWYSKFYCFSQAIDKIKIVLKHIWLISFKHKEDWWFRERKSRSKLIIHPIQYAVIDSSNIIVVAGYEYGKRI